MHLVVFQESYVSTVAPEQGLMVFCALSPTEEGCQRSPLGRKSKKGARNPVMLSQDSEELLRNLHLAPYAKPIVSLVDDFPMVQRHKGWQFGYLASNATRRMT